MGLYGVCTCVVILLARDAGAAAGAGHLLARDAVPLFMHGACSVPSLCQPISPLGWWIAAVCGL